MTARQPANRAITVVAAESILQHIVVLRGGKVLFDADLARLYGVQTRVLVQAVR